MPRCAGSLPPAPPAPRGQRPHPVGQGGDPGADPHQGTWAALPHTHRASQTRARLPRRWWGREGSTPPADVTGTQQHHDPAPAGGHNVGSCPQLLPASRDTATHQKGSILRKTPADSHLLSRTSPDPPQRAPNHKTPKAAVFLEVTPGTGSTAKAAAPRGTARSPSENEKLP